ncbi:hypothetical protein CKAH01_06847 [Colletotrichum kahawae]|uniref:Alcohol acetyltransferase n=1 Tax=Colletotrichum kahawae TaxID=34407 RepID=A0AAE0D4I1_COLKA|nr:hypothetical protein CKAH01_06847 [Colletotrichum kahawae]
MMEVKPLRSVGNLEKFLIHQHLVKFYNNVQVACIYTLSNTAPALVDSDIRGFILTALGKTVERHPILGVALTDEDSPQPSFKRLDQIDFREIVHFFEAVHDLSTVDARIQDQHQKPFHRTQDLPLWRCEVIKSPDSNDVITFALSFSFHHVVGDGLSGAAFHRTFRNALNGLVESGETSPSVSSGHEVVQVPKLDLVTHLEESMDLPLTAFFMLSKAFKAYLYSSTDTLEWSGPPIQDALPPASNTRTFYLPQGVVKDLRSGCRKHQTTITSLVTVLVARILGVLYPTHSRFIASVPFSLRKFSKHSPDDMGCFTAIAEPCFSSERSSPWGYISCRSSTTHAAETPSADDNKIWKAASECKDFIHKRSSSSDNLSVGLTKFVSDYRQHFLGMLGGRRRHAFTVTNIGVVDGGISAVVGLEKQKAVFDRVVFSAGASTSGSPYSVCLASAKDGYMSITLNWENGVVEDSSASELSVSLEKQLNRLAEAERDV